MHVIVLENEPSSFRGGQELSLLDVCRGLSQRGHDITLLYVTSGNLLQQYQEICTNVVSINSYSFDRSKSSYIFNFIRDIWKISAGKNSVVYSNHYKDVFFGCVLGLVRNIPVVCHLRLPPSRRGFRRQVSIGLKGVNSFITISNQTKLDWMKIGLKADKISVIYNGINPEVFKPSENFSKSKEQWKIPEDLGVISYVGRLDKNKGIETLIKGFALLLKSRSSTRLLIAGKPLCESESYQESLEQLVNDLGIEKYVSFLGHVTNVVSLYQVSDVTVLPSVWSEPFGRTIIESMACGTPVVASRIGGIPEILTGEFQSGLFEPGNEQELATTLNRIMNWRDSNPQLGLRCREHVSSKFSYDRMIDGIEKNLLKFFNKS